MTRSLRVLFLLTQDLKSPSGLGRYLPIGRQLARLGHQITIAALHADYANLTTKSPHQDGISIRYVAQMHVRKHGSLKTYFAPSQLAGVVLRATWGLARAALTQPADIIHIGKPHPMNSLAGVAARYLRGRQLYLDCDDIEAAIGNFSSAWQQRVVSAFEDWTPRRAFFVTTNTRFNQQRLLHLGLPKERIVYLPNGVDRARFPEPQPGQLDELRRRLLLGDAPVISFIGSLSRPGHPLDLLLDAFASVRRKVPNAILLLVGGGDDLPRLETKVKRSGLAGAVRFTGRISPQDVNLYYRLASVTVDPVEDNDAARGRSPLKLFESWACGVPFVSAAIGDRPELLGDPPAGLLAKPGDQVSLAENIIQVLQNPALANDLSRRGAQRVDAYTWEKLVPQLANTYLAHLPR